MITVQILEDGIVIATEEAKEGEDHHLDHWHQSKFYVDEERVYFSGTAQCKESGMDYNISLDRPKKKRKVVAEIVQPSSPKEALDEITRSLIDHVTNEHIDGKQIAMEALTTEEGEGRQLEIPW